MARSSNIVTFVLISVTCFTVLVKAQSECQKASITGCMEQISKSLSENSIPSSKVLGDVCGKLDTVSQCIESQGCRNGDQYVIAIWEGLRDGLYFLCNDQTAKDAITEVDDKMSSAAVKSQMVKCNKAFSDKIYNDSASYCRASNSMMECMAKATETCGEKAQRATLTFMYKYLYPTAWLNSCELMDSDNFVTLGSPSSRAPSLLAITLALVGGIMWQRA